VPYGAVPQVLLCTKLARLDGYVPLRASTGASGHHTDHVGRVAVAMVETTLERGIRHQLW